MTTLLNDLFRKRALYIASLRRHVCTHTTFFIFIFVVFAAPIIAATSVSGAAAYEAGGEVKSVPGEYYSVAGHEKKNPRRYGATPVYDGNWGYAPGGYWWNPNDMWHRSRGFWDTNSPACPFRSC